MATLRAALRLGCADRRALAATVALVVIGAAPPIGVAWFTKLLFDEVGRGRSADPSTATWYAVAIAVLGALAAIASRVSGYFTTALQNAITIAADVRLYRKLNTFVGLGPFEQPPCATGWRWPSRPPPRRRTWSSCSRSTWPRTSSPSAASP